MSSWAWSIACAALLGCAGTETGNPSLTSQLALNTHSSSPSDVGLREGTAPVVVERVWLSLERVSLLEGSNCAELSARWQTDPLGTADHAGRDPAITTVLLESGAYCGVELGFSRILQAPPGAPTDLEGYSIELSGSLADGTPFSIASALEGGVVVSAIAGSFELTPGNASLLIGFDVARWLSRIGFSSAVRDSTGSIRIDESQNAELLEAFESELAAGIEVYRDADSDAALDENPELLGRGTPGAP